VKASAVEYLIDAGPLVGAFWGRDQWHAWSRKTLVSLGADVWTTETVFAEAAHHLKPYTPALLSLLDALALGRVRLLPVFPEHVRRCAELVTKFAPRMDAGDASLVILSEQFLRARLLTIDVADFTIYRRRDGRPVPIIAPRS
jgi:predicted nucleic acid-binding protein